MLGAMFTVTEAEAAAIRRVFEEAGELSAAIEVRRHCCGSTLGRRNGPEGRCPTGTGSLIGDNGAFPRRRPRLWSRVDAVAAGPPGRGSVAL